MIVTDVYEWSNPHLSCNNIDVHAGMYILLPYVSEASTYCKHCMLTYTQEKKYDPGTYNIIFFSQEQAPVV